MSWTLLTLLIEYLKQISTLFFHGKILPFGFKISKIIQRANTFIPLLTGKIENTSSGSIIFLKYRLFPGALFLLIFWSVILLIVSICCFCFVREIEIGLGCLVAAILNYLSTLLFFGRQLKISRKLFFDIIELPLKD